MGIAKKASEVGRMATIRNCLVDLRSMSKELDMTSRGCFCPSVLYKEAHDKNGLQGVLYEMGKSIKKVGGQI